MREASVEFAGLSIAFRSDEECLLAVLADAASASPAVRLAERTNDFSVVAELKLGSKAVWHRESGRFARAESPANPFDFGAVLRAAMSQALAPSGLLVHAAAAVLDGRAILFPAHSGAGKTTLSGLLAPDCTLLSDETVCVRPNPSVPGTHLIYGSCFWSGEPRPSVAGGFPLAAICLLRWGALELTPVSHKDALPELMAQVHLPEGPTSAADAFAAANQLLAGAPRYALRFPLGARVAPFLRRALA